jgi:HEAT repeat protein
MEAMTSSIDLSAKIRGVWLATGQSENELARLQNTGGNTLEGLARIATDQSLDFPVRAAATWTLGRLAKFGRLRKVAALRPLLVALNDPNKWLRGEAARSLGVLADTRARERLIQAMRGDPEPTVRVSAAQALGMLRGPKAIQALREVLTDRSEDPGLRGATAESLGLSFAYEVTPDLVEGLRDRSPEVRFWSAYARLHEGPVRPCRARAADLR